MLGAEILVSSQGSSSSAFRPTGTPFSFALAFSFAFSFTLSSITSITTFSWLHTTRIHLFKFIHQEISFGILRTKFNSTLNIIVLARADSCFTNTCTNTCSIWFDRNYQVICVIVATSHAIIHAGIILSIHQVRTHSLDGSWGQCIGRCDSLRSSTWALLTGSNLIPVRIRSVTRIVKVDIVAGSSTPAPYSRSNCHEVTLSQVTIATRCPGDNNLVNRFITMIRSTVTVGTRVQGVGTIGFITIVDSSPSI
mmetsp:Transcript_10192/g.15323  ORF Transcript_10192/g.15323 Transcript_10192/m.15323 type:complete len:252 (+) Transcript_10192:329-1084(+)